MIMITMMMMIIIIVVIAFVSVVSFKFNGIDFMLAYHILFNFLLKASCQLNSRSIAMNIFYTFH